MLADFFRTHPIALRLPMEFDPAPLREEVTRLPEPWWQAHLGPYHNGGWESVSLWAPGGERANQMSRGSAFAATEALLGSPALADVVGRLPGTRNRIRLMRLRPGGAIFRHSDPVEDIDGRLVRLHVPILSNERVRFLVADRRLPMRPGEVWHVDVRFPHEVANEGETMRVHLVADLLRSPELEALLSRGEPAGRGYLTGYLATQMIPRRVRARLGIGN
jgi:hypothetical protein